MRKRPGLLKRGCTWHIDKVIEGQRVARSLETEDEENAARLYDQICAEWWDQKHLKKAPTHLWEEAALLYVKNYPGRALDYHRLKWLNEQLIGKPLAGINRKSVKELLKDRNSPRHYAALISAVLRVAEEEGWIDVKPQVCVGRDSVQRTRWLSEEEARQLLSQSGYLADAVLFSLATGLRQANVFGLKWAWIKDRTVMIPEEEFKQGHTHLAPLNKVALTCISRQIGKHPELVFTDNGRPLANPKAWESKWNVARRGIEDFRWHDLRHTWASWLVQNNVPEAVIETLGGWSSRKMVRRYAHASIESLRPFAEVLDGQLSRIFHAGAEPLVAVS